MAFGVIGKPGPAGVVLVGASLCFAAGLTYFTVRLWKARIQSKSLDGTLEVGSSDTSDRDVDDESDLARKFRSACAAVESNVDRVPLSARLEFYALYKQAALGDACSVGPPRLSPAAHAKWWSWYSKKGMEKSEAMKEYVLLATNHGIVFNDEMPPRTTHIFGPVQSRILVHDKSPPTRSLGDEFCCMVACGSLSSVQRALEGEFGYGRLGDPSLVHATGEGQMSALHFAADRGFVDIARLLLKHGANVNHQDDLGETPVHAALNAEQLEIVDLLARNGGDFSIRNCDGETPNDLIKRRS